MVNKMNTKNRVLWFVSLSLMVFMLLLIANVYMSEKEDIKREEHQYRLNTVLAYKNILKKYESFYKSRMEGILNSPGVFEAIKNRQRLKLYSLVQKRWEILKKENRDIKVMHFHKPDGRTFLRMHNPDKFDDNIAKKRAMCRYMHKHRKPISGFEAGIHLLGYRIMVPIFYEKEYIGAMEIGVKPNFVLNNMKELYNVSGLMFAKQAEIYDKRLVDESKPLFADYRLDSNSLDDKDIIKQLPKSYKLDGDLIFEKDGKIFAFYLFDHSDFKGEISAKTLILNDITHFTDHFYRSILKTVLFSMILYVILVFAIKIGFEKMLDKIDDTNKELQKNIAFLKSHQLAMNESSIVTKSDLKGNITYANDNFYKVTGFAKDEVIGKPHSIIRHPDSDKETFKDLWKTISSKKVWRGKLKNRGKLGDYWVDTAILPILDEDDNIVEYIAVRHNITQMVIQQQKLDSAANTDSLTGLGSRYKLTKDINNSIEPALAILNVDSFAQINDFYGHEKGDLVIVMLGSIINGIIECESCHSYHLQGDEFVVFSGNMKRADFIEKITNLIAEVSAAPINLDDEELFLSLSAAISFESKDKIMASANMALKVAKKENKPIVVYDDAISLNDEYKNNIKWSKKVKKAIETDNIIAVFQPIVNNSNGKYEKYESLVRLRDEDGKLISPYFFLEISKKIKHYTKITQIMIQRSFEMFKDKEVEFSVNLTIEDILNKDIHDYIIDALETYKIGSRVVFEIVESESIKNFEQIHMFIEKVKSYRCKIAIDDFGTGYSNFEYLMKLNADYIKIDGSMIKNIDTDKDAQMVVMTIVEFAKKMGIKVIAEFVENEKILNEIKEMGIEYSQGYYFDTPKENPFMEGNG